MCESSRRGASAAASGEPALGGDRPGEAQREAAAELLQPSCFWLQDGNSLAMVLASPRGAVGDGSVCWHRVRGTMLSSCPGWQPGCVRASSELGFMVPWGHQNPLHAGWRMSKNAMLWIQRQIQAWHERVAFTYVRAESASRCFSGWLLPLSAVWKYCCPRKIKVLLKHIHLALWNQ